MWPPIARRRGHKNHENRRKDEQQRWKQNLDRGLLCRVPRRALRVVPHHLCLGAQCVRQACSESRACSNRLLRPRGNRCRSVRRSFGRRRRARAQFDLPLNDPHLARQDGMSHLDFARHALRAGFHAHAALDASDHQVEKVRKRAIERGLSSSLPPVEPETRQENSTSSADGRRRASSVGVRDSASPSRNPRTGGKMINTF